MLSRGEKELYSWIKPTLYHHFAYFLHRKIKHQPVKTKTVMMPSKWDPSLVFVHQYSLRAGEMKHGAQLKWKIEENGPPQSVFLCACIKARRTGSLCLMRSVSCVILPEQV